MANPDYLNPLNRKQLISEIKSYDNLERKRKSLMSYEVFNDNAYKYVYDALVKQLSKKTADQMPIVSNLNIAKAVVNKEATIYIDSPKRSYENIRPSDEEAINAIYKDSAFNTSLMKSNKYFKLNHQSFIQVVPKDGKLKLRVLQPHNLDVVPDESDPEKAYAYIISTFDKQLYGSTVSDGQNQSIADADDYKQSLERYQVWTKEIVFVMDGKGDVLGEITENPIQDHTFVDVASDKDFEFFVRIGQALAQFTVDFNGAWSDHMYTSRLQSYAVGVLSGDPNLKPDSMIIGPNQFIFLPQNAEDPNSKLELDFKSPSPNLEGSLKSIESLVALFLSTRGIDIKSIAVNNSGASFSSALEKLLAMIDQFKATKSDFDLYKMVEEKIHQIVVKYMALLSGTNLLNPKYYVTPSIVNSQLTVNFLEPQMIETTAEKLDNAQKKIDLGITDAVEILSMVDGITEEAAEEKIEKIAERRAKKLQEIAIQQPEQEVVDTEEEEEDVDTEEEN